MRLTIQSALLLLCMCFSLDANAVAGTLGFGKGVSNLRTLRMAVQWDLGQWFSTDNKYHWHGYWEASGARWRASHGNLPNGRETASIFTTGPQIRLERSAADRFGNIPFMELGVGLSWLSKKNIGGRRMDMHFQFEDRFGLGLRWGPQQQYETSLRAFHYSNASLGEHNSGMNLVMVTMGKWFN